MTSYWDGKISLICPYCEHYISFPTAEALSAHIKEQNHIRDDYIKSLILLQKLANEQNNRGGKN